MDCSCRPVGPDETFSFGCGPETACFNACCRDLAQALTPYDVLRLKNVLGLTSDRFLERYARVHLGPRTGVPVVVLRPVDPPRQRCPFVAEAGCRVYADRPGSCRAYPLMRGASRSRSTGRIEERYLLLREPHCRGFGGGRDWTPARWGEDQGLVEYNRMNDRMLETLARKPRGTGPLDAADRAAFTLALYDTDRFRLRAAGGSLPGLDRMDPALREAARTDNPSLLELGHRWVEEVLFGG